MANSFAVSIFTNGLDIDFEFASFLTFLAKSLACITLFKYSLSLIIFLTVFRTLFCCAGVIALLILRIAYSNTLELVIPLNKPLSEASFIVC